MQIEKNKLFSNTIIYLPKNFYNKKVNELIIKNFMSFVLDDGKWSEGDPKKFEPDYFFNKKPYEFTLVSDKNKSDTFIFKFKTGRFTSEDLLMNNFDYINDRLEEKSKKQYSVRNVNICLLTIIQGLDFFLDGYGSVSSIILSSPIDNLIENIYLKYIKTNQFANIYLIFPLLTSQWEIYDFKKRMIVEKTQPFVFSKTMPYLIDDDLEKKAKILINKLNC